MRKTLLVVGGGIEAVPGIQRAKEMGLYVIVSDANPQAPGFALADGCLIASTYDVEATVASARQYHRRVRRVDGVICIATDVPLTVASVAAALGLPGIPIEAARLAMDKLAMKRRFVKQGIPVPWFSPVENLNHLRKLASERGYPLVLKPVDSRGSRGVLRLTPGVDLEWAYHFSRSQSPTGRVMVEEFLTGPQISTESVLLDGEGFTPGFSDRNYEFLERFSPHIIENGGHQPSALPEEAQQEVAELAVRAGLALGIRTGVVKGDLVYTNEGPKVIEIAARLSGGWFSTNQITLATGVDLIGAAIKLALGEPVTAGELRPRYRKGVAIRYLFPPPGKVIWTSGVEKALTQPGVSVAMVTVGQGDIIGLPKNSNDTAGFVIATGDDRSQAIERALAALEYLKVEVDPYYECPGGCSPS